MTIRRPCSGFFLSAFAAASVICSPLLAESPSVSVVQVEEDWELLVATPGLGSRGPQVLCTSAPLGDQENIQVAFELNHRSMWDFRAGGLQLQMWDGEYLHQMREHTDYSLLSKPGELIAWTVRMQITDGVLSVSIVDGKSESWGEFGQNSLLKVTRSTKWGHLGEYSVENSRKDSGVVYGGNRVRALRIKRVRKIHSDGSVVIDDEERVVHMSE